ncbi:hypothetical protein Aph02nite_77670 [Actinoplanes philippinensis]|uniref:SseB protein N-terminal domain-containing protein n=1 Tax=Actinoplanes philippinensis TaxID=35752 RepID=A0A1I2HHC9_9ACTN|nr:type VII secretion system-associated protein [Actinoplanes philippinensis]GIE81817.1 hypothetical protein Aph02nite_77670 [Actinoplanes philippinensis]SFF29092.1 hypothetical protein SAMN05421541_108198 [Actinoplanes philippinensis]
MESLTDGLPAGEAVLLVDPEWESDEEGAEPPIEAVVGVWPVGPDGTTGRFRSNPEYFPHFEESPSDPVDAMLRLALDGDTEMARLRTVLCDSTFALAMNGDGNPLVDRSPDDVLCVIVATSAPHRARVAAPDWRLTDLDQLLAVTAAEGYDALVNPGGPAPARLTVDFLRETAGGAGQDLPGPQRAVGRDGR